jgi:hypothetical protein
VTLKVPLPAYVRLASPHLRDVCAAHSRELCPERVVESLPGIRNWEVDEPLLRRREIGCATALVKRPGDVVERATKVVDRSAEQQPQSGGNGLATSATETTMQCDRDLYSWLSCIGSRPGWVCANWLTLSARTLASLSGGSAGEPSEQEPESKGHPSSVSGTGRRRELNSLASTP